MKKHSVNPTSLKVFSSIIIAVVLIFVTVKSNDYFVRKINRKAGNEYLEKYYLLTDSYCRSLSFYLNDYKIVLDGFYNPIIWSKASSEQIHKSIMGELFKLHPDFYNVFYVDNDGMAYISDGNIVNSAGSKIMNEISGYQTDYHISGILPFFETKELIVIISEPVFDADNNVKGLLCASVKLSTLQENFFGFCVPDRKNTVLMDKSGRFIYTEKAEYINKTFSPSSAEYRMLNSEYVSSLQNGMIQTESTDGKMINLIYHNVPGTDWTFAYIIPIEALKNLYGEYRAYSIYISLLAFAVFVILLIIEMHMFHWMEKKDVIANYFDPLTNLWNREKFEYEAKKILKKSPNGKFMVIECDIKGFKFINQNFGEEKADKLIIYLGTKLLAIAKSYNGILGRGFADHFYFFIKITTIQRAMAAFKESLAALNQEIKTYEIPFQLKFGITFRMQRKKDENTTIQNLIGQVSFAKSTIKDFAMQQYAIYNSRLLKKINQERFIENHMESALADGEFFVMYQPKISLATDKVVGAEALVRWQSSELGLLAPDAFIPIFERNGFITQLDFYVYDIVFKFIEKQLNMKSPIVPISVNMSRNHSKPDKFMHDFLQTFSKYNIPPSFVQVEIIERSVMNRNTLREITDLLHKEGFSVAMDDFGTGESSLNMLTSIPVDVLKFDRAFLASSISSEGTVNEKSAGFIQTLIEMSRNLEKQTIFEGVETEQQRDFLKSINCDQVQGYFYSKPLSESDFVQFLKLHS